MHCTDTDTTVVLVAAAELNLEGMESRRPW
jgi:hypothetical protein